MILNELQVLDAAYVALDYFQTKRLVIQVFEAIVSYKKSTKVNVLDCAARFIAFNLRRCVRAQNSQWRAAIEPALRGMRWNKACSSLKQASGSA